MTIINPRKSKRPLANPFMLFALLAMMLCVSASVALYGQTVSLKRAVHAEEGRFEAAQATGADLKRKWYQAFDAENLATLVKAHGFVKVSSPKYLPS